MVYLICVLFGLRKSSTNQSCAKGDDFVEKFLFSIVFFIKVLSGSFYEVIHKFIYGEKKPSPPTCKSLPVLLLLDRRRNSVPTNLHR